MKPFSFHLFPLRLAVHPLHHIKTYGGVYVTRSTIAAALHAFLTLYPIFRMTNRKRNGHQLSRDSET